LLNEAGGERVYCIFAPNLVLEERMCQTKMNALIAAANAYIQTTGNCGGVIMREQDFTRDHVEEFCKLQEVAEEARVHFESLTPSYETAAEFDEYQEAEQAARGAEAMRDLFLMYRVLDRRMRS